MGDVVPFRYEPVGSAALFPVEAVAPPNVQVQVTVNASWPPPLCPDLLRHDQLGAADNLRGRVVRAFFWLLRAWPVE